MVVRFVAVALVAFTAFGSPANAASSPRFRDCNVAGAARLEEPQFSDRWIEVQGLADELEAAFRASPARRDYFGMAFYNERERVHVYVRNHSHDAAIRHCARQLGINKYVAIIRHRWSKGQLLGAIKKTIRAVPHLYDAGLFEGSYGAADRFYIDVYREATAEQTRQIRRAAKATGVAFKLKRLDTSKPTIEY